MLIKRLDSSHTDFQKLVSLLDKELAVRDGDEHEFYHQFNSIESLKNCVVCYVGETPAGCGAFKLFEDKTVEIKRMYTLPDFRGKGVARKILTELETWAKELGYARSILETGVRQPEAIGLYSSYGFERIPNYGQYAGIENSLCFEKPLN